MVNRAYSKIDPLLNLLESRFDIKLSGPVEHLYEVQKYYEGKREFLLAHLGEASALACADYAKAMLISESSRLMILREIQPRPKKKKKKNED